MLALCASALAGCATFSPLPGLPQQSTDSQPAEPLSLIGPDGRVNRKTRARISARLLALGESNLLGRQLLAMEAANSRPLIAGNSVRLLVDGPRTYAAMFEAIAQARGSVNIEMFIFDEADHAGDRLSDLLVEVAGRGVAVNVLFDSVGAASTAPSIFMKLRDAGVHLCEFNPVNPVHNRTATFFQRDHRKIMVVDGQRAYAGGINFSSSYSSGSRGRLTHQASLADATKRGWRDTQVEVQGPVAQELQRLFLESWDKQKCPGRQEANYLPAAQAAGGTLLRLNASSTDSKRNETYVGALSALTFARKSIDLTMAYFTPDSQLQNALIEAARRGVRVRLLLAGFTDFGGITHAGRAHYTRLLQAGVQIFEERDALLHAKTLEVDGVWSTVGSANWDWRSFSHNDELNIVIIDQGFAAQMRAQFETDIASAAPIRLSDWQHRAIRERVLDQFWAFWERLL